MSTTRATYAGPLVLVTAVVALITGPALWVNGLTMVDGPVDVPVRYTAAAETSASTGPDATLDHVRLSVPPAVADPDGGAPIGVSLTVDDDGLDLAVWDSTYREQMLPLAATNLVLARLGVQVPGGVLELSFEPDLAPLLLIAVLLALAEAFRQGERLARETDGLV